MSTAPTNLPIPPIPSLREVMGVAGRYKWLLVLTFLLPLAGSLAVCFLIKPTYESNARLLVRTGQEYIPRPDTAGASQTSPSTSMREIVETEVELLKTREVLADVVRSMSVGKLYPSLAGVGPDDAPALEVALRALSDDLSIAPVKLTNVIDLRLRNIDPSVANDALTLFIARFQELHTRAFSRNRSSVIQAQLEAGERSLAALERERTEYETAHALYSAAEQRTQLVLQHSTDAQELGLVERQRTATEARGRAIEGQLARLPLTVPLQTTTQSSPVSEDAQKRARDLEERRQDLLARGYGAGWGELTGSTAALNSVRRSLAQTSSRNASVTIGANPLVATLEAQLAALQADAAPLALTSAALQSSIDQTDAGLSELARNEVALRNYDRRIADLDTTTTTLRGRLADARYLEELDRAQFASVQVVQSPVASDRPVWPKKRLIAAAGLLAGLLTSSFALLLALSFGNYCLTVETVERLLGTPVLAVLNSTPLLPGHYGPIPSRPEILGREPR